MLQELMQFLQPSARVDLKLISLDHVLSLSGSESGVQFLLEEEKLVELVIELTKENNEVGKQALLTAVNISAHACGTTKLIKCVPSCRNNILELLVDYIIDAQKKDADAACMILSNITRVDNTLDICVDALLPHLHDLLNVLVNTSYNKQGAKLHYVAPILSNLTRSPRVRKWWIETTQALSKLLPFCNYEQSHIRRGGAIGTVRNLSFDTSYHNLLLDTKLDLLSHLLSPIMGGEEYIDEEMNQLPDALQYLPTEKRRDPDVDIRKMVIETLNKFCALKHGRESLRNNGVYYVLREYHKWEKDPQTLVACENVVDILIQNEDEVGADDLSSVEIPEDVVGKFNKISEQNSTS